MLDPAHQQLADRFPERVICEELDESLSNLKAELKFLQDQARTDDDSDETPAKTLLILEDVQRLLISEKLLIDLFTKISRF